MVSRAAVSASCWGRGWGALTPMVGVHVHGLCLRAWTRPFSLDDSCAMLFCADAVLILPGPLSAALLALGWSEMACGTGQCGD